MNCNGYTGKVWYSKEDKCFKGCVLGLKTTCLLFHAPTEEECWKAFFKSVNAYLQRCKKEGIEPEVPSNDTL
jgi:predicted HicB family RNase H-like nuclease